MKNYFRTLLYSIIRQDIEVLKADHAAAVTKGETDLAQARAESAAAVAASDAVHAKKVAELREALNILHNELAKESSFFDAEINHLYIAKRDAAGARSVRPYRSRGSSTIGGGHEYSIN